MRHLLAAVLAAVLLPLVASPAHASPDGGAAGAPRATAARPGPIDVVGLDFQVISAAGGRCLATTGGAVVVRPCAAVAAFRWRFRPASFAGTLQLLNVGTGRCLSGAAGAAARCDDHPARHWRLLDAAGETANLSNVHSRRCLAAGPGGTVRPGRCDDVAAHRWTVRVLSVPFLGS